MEISAIYFIKKSFCLDQRTTLSPNSFCFHFDIHIDKVLRVYSRGRIRGPEGPGPLFEIAKMIKRNSLGLILVSTLEMKIIMNQEVHKKWPPFLKVWIRLCIGITHSVCLSLLLSMYLVTTSPKWLNEFQ